MVVTSPVFPASMARVETLVPTQRSQSNHTSVSHQYNGSECDKSVKPFIYSDNKALSSNRVALTRSSLTPSLMGLQQSYGSLVALAGAPYINLDLWGTKGRLTGVKDAQWLTLDVCREFMRNKCTRNVDECRFAHPPPHIEVQQGRVICCFDSIKDRCQRKDPPCKYLHPPQHLREQLIQNGRNNLLMKHINAQILASTTHIIPTLPVAYDLSALTAMTTSYAPQQGSYQTPAHTGVTCDGQLYQMPYYQQMNGQYIVMPTSGGGMYNVDSTQIPYNDTTPPPVELPHRPHPNTQCSSPENNISLPPLEQLSLADHPAGITTTSRAGLTKTVSHTDPFIVRGQESSPHSDTATSVQEPRFYSYGTSPQDGGNYGVSESEKTVQRGYDIPSTNYTDYQDSGRGNMTYYSMSPPTAIPIGSPPPAFTTTYLPYIVPSQPYAYPPPPPPMPAAIYQQSY